MKLFNIIFLFAFIFILSCGDDGGVSSNIPQITSTPDKVTLPYYPWDDNSELADPVTQKFEIFNKGKKELTISRINILDPSGNLIKSSTNDVLKNLFKLQISKTSNGKITGEWGEKVLEFNNESNDLLSLCPVESVTAETKKCSSYFNAAKYNSHLKILLSYSKDAATSMKNGPADSNITGDFMIEICSNDPLKNGSETCPEGSGSFRITVRRLPAPPPKPLIIVNFDNTVGGPMSYRNIKDDVSINLKNTCVSDQMDPSKCLSNWQDKYYIRYRWEMIETPTPLRQESAIQIPDSAGRTGQWLPDLGYDNPKRSEFTALMITPKRLEEDNPNYDDDKCISECGEAPVDTTSDQYPVEYSNYLLCRQRYCEKTETEYYKVKIQAETIDRLTGVSSKVAEVTVIPRIIPQARVVAQLTWKQGFKTSTEAQSDMEGTKVDLDIHLIKKSSLEAAKYKYKPETGVMCTSQKFTGMSYDPQEDLDNDGNPDYEKYFRHDDCYFADQGTEFVSSQEIDETIAWNASFDLNNYWGGGNFQNPETIGLGPIEDLNGDGSPDKKVIDDQYLVVVSYSYCTSKFEDNRDTCCDPADSDCSSESSAYEVDARVDILIDGIEAGRPERTQGGEVIRPADKYSETTRNFKIKPDEWKVIAVVKWDSSLPGPEHSPSYTGDAIVTDVAMEDEEININPSEYQTCRFDITLCETVPIWDEQAYYKWVDQPQNPNDDESPMIGECY